MIKTSRMKKQRLKKASKELKNQLNKIKNYIFMMEELTGSNYLIAKSAVKQVYNYYGTTDADDEEDIYDGYIITRG